MTAALMALGALGLFAGGFLYGENRSVRQCNSILDENWRELMKAIREDGAPEPFEDRRDRPSVPTRH